MEYLIVNTLLRQNNMTCDDWTRMLIVCPLQTRTAQFSAQENSHVHKSQQSR